MEQLQRCRATKQNKKQKKTFQLESKKGGEFVKRERRINERTPRQNGQAVFYSLKLQNVTSLKTDLFPFSFLHISLSLSFLGRFVSTCLPTYLPTYLPRECFLFFKCTPYRRGICVPVSQSSIPLLQKWSSSRHFFPILGSSFCN